MMYPTPQKQPARKRHTGRNILIGLGVIVVLVIALAAIGAAAGGGKPAASPPAAASSYKTPSLATAPAPAPAPSPDVTYQVSGDYLIPPGIDGQVYVIGEIDLTNSGSQGATVRCRMGWQMEGSPDITAHRTARMPAGASKVLRFRIAEGSFSGNGENVINQIQSWQNAHSAQSYGDGRCVMTGTF